MVSEIRLIASDLDGTLLRNDKTLSPYTLSVIKRCRERGIWFFPVTARPPRALEDVIPGLEYDGAICHNGAVAVIRKEIIWEQGMEPEVAAKLIRRILKKLPSALLAAEIGGDLYANFPATNLWPGTPYLQTDYASVPDKTAEKLIVGISGPEEAAALEEIVPDGLAVVVSENRVAMIQPRNVEKGKALEAVCGKLGLSPAQAVGFGDDWNDIPLLRACGVGVAMENALPEVKQAAGRVCRSNEEEGVARWLEEHVLS